MTKENAIEKGYQPNDAKEYQPESPNNGLESSKCGNCGQNCQKCQSPCSNCDSCSNCKKCRTSLG